MTNAIQGKWAAGDLPLINESTGPDSSKIPFYGTSSFKMSGSVHLEDSTGLVKLYEGHNIYFVRAVECEWGESGAFLLLVEHFEDGMLSAYTYRLSAEDGRELRRAFPDIESLREQFGFDKGGDDFLRYCVRMKYSVDYTEFWFI